jgi:hypothetical protein
MGRNDENQIVAGELPTGVLLENDGLTAETAPPKSIEAFTAGYDRL